MEHLALEILSREKNGASQYAWLPENASISITDTSEIFDKGNLWSHDFQLNIPANAHIFGTAGEMHGSRLHEQIDKRKARLWVEGLPLFLGYLRLADEVEVDKDGNVDVTFESGQKTFEEMIEGAKANQVPISDDILIGMAVDRERELLRTNVEIRVSHLSNIDRTFGYPPTYLLLNNARLVSKDFKSQIFPKFVRPDGTWKESDTDDEYTLSVADTINTDIAYDDGHPYCNVTICYQDREYKSNGSSMEENAIRGYHVSSPRRINPAPNFYVLYWFKLLMKHLGITIEENQMLNVEDLCRLFFVNTKCAYKTKDDKTYRGDYMPFGKSTPFVPQPSTEEPSWSIKAEPAWEKNFYEAFDIDEAVITNVGVGVEDVTWQPAYATSGNFPDVDIQEVINGLESGFGVRLAFNKDYTLVRVLLLRNIFRSQDIHEIQGTIISAEKRDNCVRGFRLTYGGGEDNTAYNYKGFLLAKKKNEGNWELPPEAHDYTKFEFYENYTPILNNAKCLSPTCYVAMNTGNSYVVKIDEDFKDASNDPFPSLFECAQYMDAEDGNCTGEDETIEEVHINFTPAIMSAVEEPSGASSTDTSLIDYSRVGMNYAFFISKEMGVPYKNADAAAQYLGQSNNYKRAIDTTPSEFLEKMKDSLIYSNGGYTNTKEEPKYRSGLLEVATPVSFKATDENGNETISFTKNGRTFTYKLTGWIREGYRLYLDDNFKITDEMLSPLEDMDWGLSLGILRGSTSSLYAGRTIYESDTEEGEGNDYWITMPGDSASANPDICNDMGELWLRSTMQPFTGYEYGDKLLAEAGCTNQCDLKTRKGPHPRRPDIYNIIDTYYISDRPRLLLLSNEGYYATADTIMSADGDTYTIWLCCVNGNNALMRYDFMQEYISYLQNGTDDTPPTDIDTILARDAAGHTWQGIYASNMIIGINPTKPSDVLKNVATYYNEGNAIACYDYDDETSTSGAVSLKLRSEKPNPDFDPTLGGVIKTKTEAAKAMQSLYKTANTNLLARPIVSGATMRAAGWSAEAGDYATIYSIGKGVEYSDGKVHEILWTPICEDGTVFSPEQLQSYVNTFEGLASSKIIAHDTQHLILDIDTTEERAEILHQLQAVYYAAEGEEVEPVNISAINRRYLEITNPNLRGRGLMDQFYKEYSYWVRNARIARMTVRMELAQLLSIDKTKRVRVGDITGFIRKMEYQVSNQSGLGLVTMEIMYI